MAVSELVTCMEIAAPDEDVTDASVNIKSLALTLAPEEAVMDPTPPFPVRDMEVPDDALMSVELQLSIKSTFAPDDALKEKKSVCNNEEFFNKAPAEADMLFISL